jgi:hypothetical protein
MKTFTREIEQRQSYFPQGWGNGYVAIPPDSPLHGRDFYSPIFNDIGIHGGLTFSEMANVWNDKFLKENNIPKDWWVVGFDTAHLDDNLKNCSREFVLEETENLRKQLIKLDQKVRSKKMRIRCMGKEYEMQYFGGKEDLTNGVWLIIYENKTKDMWIVADDAVIGYEDYEKIEYEEDFYGLRIPLFDADNFLNNFEIIKESKIANDNLWESIVEFIEDHRKWNELRFSKEDAESIFKILGISGDDIGNLPSSVSYSYMDECIYFYMKDTLRKIIRGMFKHYVSCKFGDEEFSLSTIIDGKLYHYHNAYYTAD